MVTTSGTHKHRWPAEHLSTRRRGADAQRNDGSGTHPTSARSAASIRRAPRAGASTTSRCSRNLEILIYERGWYVTYRYWPTHDTHVFEATCSSSPRRARERLAHEYAAVTFKEYGLRDAATLDGTQMGLEQRAFDDFPLNDQEILVRHFHATVRDWVDGYVRERATGRVLRAR